MLVSNASHKGPCPLKMINMNRLDYNFDFDTKHRIVLSNVVASAQAGA